MDILPGFLFFFIKVGLPHPVYLYILVYMKHNYLSKQSNSIGIAKRSKTVVRMLIAILVLLLGSASIVGANESLSFPSFQQPNQTSELSDQDLRRFGETLLEVQEIQMEANETIQQTIETSPLPEERLEEIFVMAQEDPSKAQDTVEQSEWTAYTQVMESLAEIQIEAQQSMVGALAEHDYEVEEFNTIAQKIQSDPELTQRLQSLFSNRS